jgi:putative membrane protein
VIDFQSTSPNQGAPQPVNLTNELAKERNREAAQRTLLAWIRTSLSLISFGFGIDKIVDAIDQSGRSTIPHGELSVRVVSISFIGLGIFAVCASIVEHRRILRQIGSDNFVYKPVSSVGMITAAVLLVIGVFALFVLVLRLS